MNTIFKYKIGEETKLPKNSLILSANVQDGTFYVWARIDTEEEETEIFRFYVYGTGWETEGNQSFLNSVFDDGFVWHVFYARA